MGNFTHHQKIPMNFNKLTLQLPIQIIILLVAAFALYSQSLHAPFVFDDFSFFTSPDILAKYGNTYFNFGLRWLPYTTLIQTTHWVGVDGFWLRIENITLHAANAIALLFLLRKLFIAALHPSNSTQVASNQSHWLAFFGAAIFILHPIATYGVTYLIQRSILMATFFTLLMLITYLQGLIRGGWLWMIAAAFFYLAAVYAKEHSIAGPGVALAMTILVRKPSLNLVKYTAPYFILCTFIAIAVTINIRSVIGEAYEPHAMEILNQSAQKQGVEALPSAFLLSILTQSFLFFKYLGLWLFPNPAWMSVDMREPFALSFLSWPHTLGFLGFIAYPCAAIWLLLKKGKLGLFGFALLFPWLLFLTEISTVRAQEPFVLYRSYLWMPGLMASLPFLCAKISPKNAFLVLGLIAMSLVPLSLNRLNTFSSALLLWDDAEKLVRDKHNIPGVERIYYNRGRELGLAGKYNEAIADFTTTIKIYPGYDFFYCDRATALYQLAKFNEALLDYNRAILINPSNPISYRGRALVYRALGDEGLAQKNFQESCLRGICQ
jgi:tetratricopeptide (TPR) repeat protein